jgi:2-iminoacetate synthase
MTLDARTIPSRFSAELDALPLPEILAAGAALGARAREALDAGPVSLEAAAALLDPECDVALDEILARARDLTDRTFGRSILMYAPCYLSSFCVSHCAYCGFSFPMDIPRRQLTPEEAVEEISLLAGRGMKRVLLVAGDFPRMATPDYIAQVLGLARGIVPEIDLEVAPARTGVYHRWAEAGAGGVTCYQETYNPFRYAELHTRGPKVHYEQRLGAIERAGAAGMKRLGLGVLLGLADPVRDLLALIAHAGFLGRLFPDVSITASLPRLRPAVAEFRPSCAVGDDSLLRFYAVLRLALPHVGLVGSTRESPAMRRRLLDAGITQMSAGSVTVPGGYGTEETEGPQFDIADHRPVAEVVEDLQRMGYTARWEVSPHVVS